MAEMAEATRKPTTEALEDLFIDPELDRAWVETLLTIESEDEGIIPWTCTEQQVRILDTTRRIRKLVIIKGRQTRCSTILLAKAIRKAVTSYGQNFVIITQTNEMSQNFRQFIKNRFEDLAKLGFEYDFSTKNGGMDNEEKLRIAGRRCTFHFASAEQKVGLRGIQTAHWVHASEVAHWPEDSAKRIMGALLPASPPTGFFVAESTPNGAAGWFYEKATNSVPLVPVSLWTVAFYPWWLEPKYNIKSYIGVLADMGISLDKLRLNFIPSPAEEALMNQERLGIDQMLWRRFRADDLLSTGQYFAQEYPENLLSCWLASGTCFFHDDLADHLGYYRGHVQEPAQKRRTMDYTDPVTGVESVIDLLGPSLLVWESPQAGHQYVAFLDLSAGAGEDSDYSALVILDVTQPTHNHVATLRIRTLPSRVGAMAAAVSRWYNWAYLGVERNAGYGTSALEKLQEMHYPNLFYDMVNQPEKPQLGWYTSPQSRERMLAGLRERVFNHTITIPDQMAIIEMGGFTWRKVQGRSGVLSFRAEAERGNDDMVMALAGACAIAPYAPRRVRLGHRELRVGPDSSAEDSIVLDGRTGVVVQRGGSAQLPWLI